MRVNAETWIYNYLQHWHHSLCFSFSIS